MEQESKAPRVRWSDRIDLVVSACKWPAAWAALILTPLLVWSLLRLTLRVLGSPVGLFPFAVGAAVFILVWRRWLGSTRIGKFAIRLEHESTHALFALLTMHRIVGFWASLDEGGQVRFEGRGNWLVTVAPYFFPTAALLLFAVAFFLPFPGLPWPSVLLGVALGYHIVSTYRETHRDQTDIQELGQLFCWFFLPAANLAVVGLLISFAHNGSEGMSAWFRDIMEPVNYLISLVSSPDDLPLE